MNDFFRKARYLYDSQRLQGYETEFELVESFREEIQKCRVKANVDINNLEYVFNAIEMNEIIATITSFNTKKTNRLRDSFKKLIVGTIQGCQKLELSAEFRHGEGWFHKTLGPKGYNRLVKLIKSELPKHNFSIMSFNYDLGLEAAFNCQGVPYFYPTIEETPNFKTVMLLKPHGSLNWFVDPTQNKIHAFQPNTSISYLQKAPEQRISCTFDQSTEFSPLINKFKLNPIPFIVPPAESKRDERSKLKKLWKTIASEVKKADVFLVIGYSLPDTDTFFKQFFALASDSSHVAKSFFVFDVSKRSIEKVHSMLGPSLLECFTYFQGTFSSCIGLLEEAYKASDNDFWPQLSRKLDNKLPD